MNLRKLLPVLLITLSATLVTPAFAAAKTPPVKTGTPAANARSQQLEDRIREIKNMDKSNLTARERHELRRELRHIKDENRHNGIYISVGAFIIIILLLILLL